MACAPCSSILWGSTYSPCVRMLKLLILAAVISFLPNVELPDLALQGWMLPLSYKTLGRDIQARVMRQQNQINRLVSVQNLLQVLIPL